MKHKTIKIDTCCNGNADYQLLDLLDAGWIILDKTVTNDRYIYFILEEPSISGVNAQSAK